MQHLDDGFLHAIADGEVPSDELGPVREHLEACESCRARLDEARIEAETARELIELIEVPVLVLDGPTDPRTDGPTDRRTDQPTNRPSRVRWMRTFAWAATLVLAAGVGYYGRGRVPFAAPTAEPISMGRIDTVFLDIPAASDEARANESNRNAGLDRVSKPAEPQAVPPAQAAPTARKDAQSEVAGARREDDKTPQRRTLDSTIRLSEVVVTATAEGDRGKASTTEKKELEAKLSDNLRQRAANDVRDQSAAGLTRKTAAQPAAPPAALAEERFMAKSAADAAAVAVTFPRAVELLGGRIKLIEGMVPARLEATGKVVQVIYRVDEGDVVLAQVSGVDSVLWSLSGPLRADSLAKLRARVR